MTKQQRKLALARLLCDELKESIINLEKQLNDKSKFYSIDSGRADMHRKRIMLNKILIEEVK